MEKAASNSHVYSSTDEFISHSNATLLKESSIYFGFFHGNLEWRFQKKCFHQNTPLFACRWVCSSYELNTINRRGFWQFVGAVVLTVQLKTNELRFFKSTPTHFSESTPITPVSRAALSAVCFSSSVQYCRIILKAKRATVNFSWLDGFCLSLSITLLGLSVCPCYVS